MNSVRTCWLSDKLADLKTESSRVRDIIKRYLRKLVELGVDGFRFDAAKHIEPDFFADVLTEFPDQYAFGEVIVDNSAEIPNIEVLDFYDFPLVAAMKDAFAFGGDLRSLINAQKNHRALPGPKAITF